MTGHVNLLDAYLSHKREVALAAHRTRWDEIDAAWLAGETAPLLATVASTRVNPISPALAALAHSAAAANEEVSPHALISTAPGTDADPAQPDVAAVFVNVSAGPALNECAPVPATKPTYANPIMHRGWRIYYDAPPGPSNRVWRFVSDDYDAEQDADGVWTDNGLCGDGSSVQDCIDQINELIAEQDYEIARGQRENDLAD